MSTLALFRPVSLEAVSGLADFSVCALETVAPSGSYLEAIRFWNRPLAVDWYVVDGLRRRSLDAAITASLASVDEVPAMRELFRTLAGASTEVALWCSGFPDEIEIMQTPDAFADAIAGMLLAGDCEPALRFVR